MLRLSKADHDLVLDLWVQNASTEEIARRANITTQTVINIAYEARKIGDKRATRRVGLFNKMIPSDARKQKISDGMKASWERRRRRRLAKRFAPTPGELAAAVASATVAVTRCPPGVHLGWRPSWF